MSDRLKEYFMREASEYLDELERLMIGSPSPDPDQFFRLATGIRGSAQMAEARGVAVLAEALEDAARGLAAGTMQWSSELQALATDTVNDLKELIAALGQWGAQEEERLRNAVGRWDKSGGTPAGSATGHDAIPISDLFYDDAGPHILTEESRAPDSGVEAVSVSPLEVTTDEATPQSVEWTGGAASEEADASEAVPISELLLTSTDEAPPAVGWTDGAAEEADANDAVPISELLLSSGDEAGPPRPGEWTDGAATAAEEAGEPVPIGELLFRGSAAFREALALRPRIQLAARQGPSASLDDLLDELFDLVELGMGPPDPNEG